LNYLGASFGIAIADPSVDDIETVLKEADRLMYVDKQLRRGQSELRLVQ
jgi:predicted signal transduction protein with EAL and GGDEF domain